MKKQIVILILILSAAGVLFIVKGNFKKADQENQKLSQGKQPAEDELKIVSTTPDPLEGATILPTQNIEFKFNKQIAVSEFKHRFDPNVDHNVEVNYNKQTNITIVTIKFSKPLDLGNGYTLFVLANTDSEDGKKLNRDYNYHFSTIKYKGV